MTALPTDAAIRTRAEELGLLEPGADLPSGVRKRVARELLQESQKPPVAVPDLISRTNYPVAGGTIRVDVLFVPNPKEPSDGK